MALITHPITSPGPLACKQRSHITSATAALRKEARENANTIKQSGLEASVEGTYIVDVVNLIEFVPFLLECTIYK